MFRYFHLLRKFNIFGKMEKVRINHEIKLTPEEEKIFEILRHAQSSHDKEVVLRVAGGWVRDKVEISYTRSLAESPLILI